MATAFDGFVTGMGFGLVIGLAIAFVVFGPMLSRSLKHAETLATEPHRCPFVAPRDAEVCALAADVEARCERQEGRA